MAIGDIEVLDISDDLVKFDKSDNKYVWSLDKPKNITTQHMIINRYLNAKIKERVKEVKCPERHRVKISAEIVAIDKVLVDVANPFVGLHDKAKLEVNNWKKQGVSIFVSNKKQ